MWFEFPDNEDLYSIHSQFMFGSSILVAPKVKNSTAHMNRRQMQEVDFYLPTDATWYNYYTKMSEN